MSEVDEKMLIELSAATSATVEQLRAAFALQRLYKRRRSKAVKEGDVK